MGNKNRICCLCGKEITHIGYDEGEYLGNNPHPLSENEDDRCCDECNETKVIPARLNQIYGGTK